MFSNAAMHWILRDSSTRTSFFENVYGALKEGGSFVFEMGGFGNVAEVHAALTAALIADGCPPSEARESSPWFFPTEGWLRGALEAAGFEVDLLEQEHRLTELTMETETGNGGLQGWIRLFGAAFLDKARDKDAFVKFVSDTLECIIARPEDGRKCVRYLRLRGVARKKVKSR